MKKARRPKPPRLHLVDPWRVVGTVSEAVGEPDVRVDGRRWPQGGHEHFR